MLSTSDEKINKKGTKFLKWKCGEKSDNYGTVHVFYSSNLNRKNLDLT